MMGAVLLGLAVLAGLSAAMAIAWRIALATGKSGWIDASWSFALGLACMAVSLVPLSIPGHYPRQLLVAALVGIWALRLGSHIAARTAGGGDDPRYAELRKEWGDDYRQRLFWFLQVQAGAAALLTISIAAAARNPYPGLRTADWLGVLVFSIAIAGEALADRQLTAFRAEPSNKGKVCDAGLWSWSRHPNYFFEWLVWVSYVPIAVAPGHPFGWVALAGPAFMYWLLVHVSGVPLLEAHMLRSRGQAFRRYQARVNTFWPRPPRQ